MKRTCCLVALSLLPLLCAPAASAQEADPQMTAALPAATGTTSLLGHWVANNGTTHYYFGQNEVIIVNQLRRRDNSIAQHKQKLEYAMTALDENWMQIELQTPLDWAETRFLRIADDRQSITELMQIMGHSFQNQWTRVSDRQQP